MYYACEKNITWLRSSIINPYLKYPKTSISIGSLLEGNRHKQKWTWVLMINTSRMLNASLFNTGQKVGQFSEVCTFKHFHLSQPSRNPQLPGEKGRRSPAQYCKGWTSWFHYVLTKRMLFSLVWRHCQPDLLLISWERTAVSVQRFLARDWRHQPAQTRLCQVAAVCLKCNSCLTAYLTKHKSYFKIKPPGFSFLSSFKARCFKTKQ